MASTTLDNEIKLNLGCGGRPLEGYVNVDFDTLDQIKSRYPVDTFSKNITEVYQYDIFNLPFENGSVQEVRTDSMIEHLSFPEEPKFFREVDRVLSPGGLLSFATPDFEEVVKIWLNAKDDWKDFYRSDDEAIKSQHWFGNNSFSLDNRWGYLTAALYGPQNSEGQFHKNCYTEEKIIAIMRHLKFEEPSISRFFWKNTHLPMLQVNVNKASKLSNV